MKNAIPIILLLIGFYALADTKCDLIAKASLSLAVHAANFSNTKTTRTPEGGSYKYQFVECQHGCQILTKQKIRLVYEPDNSDADKNGYVRYPDINKEAEYFALSAYAKILRNFGNQCPQKIEIHNNETSTLVKYMSGNIKTDIFNFKPDGNLASWIREPLKGQDQIYSF